MVHGVNRKDGERAGSGGVYRVRRLPMSPASPLRAVLFSLPLSVLLSIIIMAQGLSVPQLARAENTVATSPAVSASSLKLSSAVSSSNSLSSAVSTAVKGLSSKIPPATDLSVRKAVLSEASKLAGSLPHLGGTDPSGWQQASLPTGASSITGSSCSGSLCMATGAGTSGAGVDLFVSVNEGLTWTASTISGDPNTLAVSCASSSTCYVLATTSTASTTLVPKLYVTTDAGTSWSGIQLPAGVLTSQLVSSLPVQLQCPSTTECALFGENSTSYALDFTTDEGASWSSVGLTSGIYPTGLSCPDISECMVSGALLPATSGTTQSPAPAVISVTDLTSSPVVSSDTSFATPAAANASVDTNLWPLNLLMGGVFSATLTATASTLSTGYPSAISCPSAQT